jgi:hypothetical protein
MTRGIRVTQPTKHQKTDKHRKTSQEELARSLERELGLLAEERRDRARRLGFDTAQVSPDSDK